MKKLCNKSRSMLILISFTIEWRYPIRTRICWTFLKPCPLILREDKVNNLLKGRIAEATCRQWDTTNQSNRLPYQAIIQINKHSRFNHFKPNRHLVGLLECHQSDSIPLLCPRVLLTASQTYFKKDSKVIVLIIWSTMNLWCIVKIHPNIWLMLDRQTLLRIGSQVIQHHSTPPSTEAYIKSNKMNINWILYLIPPRLQLNPMTC